MVDNICQAGEAVCSKLKACSLFKVQSLKLKDGGT